MSAVVGLVVALPLLAAMVALGIRSTGWLRDLVTMGTLLTVSALSVGLLVEVESGGSVVVWVGDWSPDLGIVLVADMFAVLVLAVAMITITLVELFAIGQRRSRAGADPTVVGPVLLVLTGGVALSILTGDLFTLFVAFELMLVASYVLLTHQGRRGQVRSGMTYVVINLFASTLFLFGVAFVYAATGTVNLALLAERIPELGDGTRWGIGLWFLVVFGTKAAIFPLFSWLPDSYPTAPTTITAVFAGLLTKIGVYVLIRFHTLTGMDDLGPTMLVLAGLTMLVGVAGALAQDDMKRILSFHIVSQIGYMLMGLGLFSVAGVAGAVLFIVHQIPVKTVLFLVGGLVESDRGTSALDRISGLIASRPFVAAMFALPALSLAGLPPFSGFVAKLALVDAGIDQVSVVIVVVALVGSILTLLSMAKIWLGVFWGAPDGGGSDVASGGDAAGSSPTGSSPTRPSSTGSSPTRPSPTASSPTGSSPTGSSPTGSSPTGSSPTGSSPTGSSPTGSVTRGSWSTMNAATGLAVALTLAIAVFAGPLWDMSERSATELLEREPYVSSVLAEDPVETAEPGVEGADAGAVEGVGP